MYKPRASGNSPPRSTEVPPKMQSVLSPPSALHSPISPLLHDYTRNSTGGPIAWNQTVLGDLDSLPARQHVLSYSGAGRFWRPADGNDNRKGLFKRRRNSEMIKQAQLGSSSPAVPQPLSSSVQPQEVIQSPSLPNLSCETSSILSEHSLSVVPRSEADGGVESEKLTTSQVELPITQENKPPVTSPDILRNGSDGERQKKARKHLQRLFDEEEARVAHIRAEETLPVDPEPVAELPSNCSIQDLEISVKAPKDSSPEDSSSKDSSSKDTGSVVLGGLHIHLDLPRSAGWDASLFAMHTASEVTFTEEGCTEEACTEEASKPLYNSPDDHIQNCDCSRCMSSTLENSKPESEPSTHAETKSPSTRALSAVVLSPHSLSETLSAPPPVPPKEPMPPLGPRRLTSPAVLHDRDHQDTNEDSKLCLAQSLRIRSVQATPTLVSQTRQESSAMSLRSNSVANIQSIETAKQTQRAVKPSESLFAGLDQIRKSLPSRNTKPELSRLSSRSKALALAEEVTGDTTDHYDRTSNTSCEPSPGRFELSSSTSKAKRPSPRASALQADPGRALESLSGALSPLSPASLSSNASCNSLVPSAKRKSPTRSAAQATRLPPLTIMDIEPDIDPRTGKRYVNRSRGDMWESTRSARGRYSSV